MVEYDATLMMAHQAHVTPAPMFEYDAAPTVAHWVHAAPATAARAAPPPLVDGPVVKVVHVPQVQVVEKTIEIPHWQDYWGKSSIFWKPSLSKAPKLPRVWTSSRPRRRSLSKQFFMRLTRICAATTLRRCAAWHVSVESACGDASGTIVQLLWMRQNLRGHGEGFRNAYVTRKSSTR